MTLPALSNWDSTKTALHQAAQVIGGVRKVVVQPQPNYAHLGLFVDRKGVTTGKLPDGSELVLDFTQQAILYNRPGANSLSIALNGQTQVELVDTLIKALKDAGSRAELDRSKLAATDKLDPNPAVASEYTAALNSIYTAIARFRGRLFGSLSPIIIFPHGFDLSFLWFSHGFNEGQDPHLNIGFSPGSAGFPRPYVYAYAYPVPDGLFDVKLPEPAHWIQTPWKGLVIDYDKLAAMPDAEETLEALLTTIFASVAPLLS